MGFADETQFPVRLCSITDTIDSGSLSSSGADLLGTSLQAVVTPAALTGTSLTCYASADGSTYYLLTNAQGTTISMTVAASRYITVDPTVNWRAVRWLRVVSSGAEAAARTLTYLSFP